jgi:prevent-host-death family protein
MLRTIPTSQAKYHFGQVLRRVYETGEVQIIERAGLPGVGIVPLSDIARLYPEKAKALPQVARRAKRQQAWQELMGLLREIGNEAYSEPEVEADILSAVAAVRSDARKK